MLIMTISFDEIKEKMSNLAFTTTYANSAYHHTLILKIISSCDVKHIMKLAIKTITSVFGGLDIQYH
jgi:hypothetical protein